MSEHCVLAKHNLCQAGHYHRTNRKNVTEIQLAGVYPRVAYHQLQPPPLTSTSQFLLVRYCTHHLDPRPRQSRSSRLIVFARLLYLSSQVAEVGVAL
jgi:hypothetical protein